MPLLRPATWLRPALQAAARWRATRPWRAAGRPAVPMPARPTAAAVLVFEAFEPRILYSADVSPLLLSGLAEPALQASPTQDDSLPGLTQARSELVFVDMGLPDAQRLLDDLQAQADAGRALTVVRIDADADGLALISQTLVQHQGVGAVHLLAHGSDGQLQLGATRLDEASLLARAAEVAGWRSSLSGDADLLLYGCDLAAGPRGQALMNSLAALSGADVAASTDATGAAHLGGDWVLERQTGRIESALAPSAAGQAQWQAVMSLLAQDDFASSGNLNGKGGGSGWAGNWVNGDSKLQGTGNGNGLADPTGLLPVSGGAVTLQLNVALSSSLATRELSTTLGADGSTTWISFLLQPEALASGDFMGLEFGSPDSTVAFAGYSGGSFVLGASGTLTPSTVAGLSPQSGEAVLMVLKLEHRAGADTLTLYVNPTPGRLTPEATYTATTQLDLGSFTRIGITGGVTAGSNKASIDEIRIGQSYIDVAPSAQAVAPVITSNGGGASATVSLAENQTAVTTVVAQDGNGNTGLSYQIVGGADAGRFSLDSSTGVLRFLAAPDYEAPSDANADGVYELVVQASDGVLTDQQSLSVKLTDVREAPVLQDDTANSGSGTAVLVPVLDNDLPAEGGSLRIIDASNPLHGSVSWTADGLIYQSAAGYTGADSLRYRVTDGTDGLAHYWSLHGHAQDGVGSASGSLLNEPDVIEGVDGQALQFDGDDDHVRLTDVSYGAEFSLSVWFRLDDNEGTGYRYLYAHGDPSASNSLNVYFIESDTSTGSGVQNVLRTSVVDGNDSAQLADLDIDASALADGQWHLYTLTTRSGVGSTVYIDGVQRSSSSNGGDAINPGGIAVLGANSTYSSTRYFEGALDTVQLHNKALSSAEILAIRDGQQAEATVRLSVSARPNTAPDFTSHGGAASVSLTVVENGSLVSTLQAVDAEGDAVSYRIIGGADGDRFVVDSSTGVLSWVAAPDHEAPVDAGGNNVYEVVVQASDGSLSSTQVLQVGVSDLNEAPTISSGGGGASAVLSVDEHSVTVGTVVAGDPEGASLVYSIVGGADAALFSVNAATGVLSFRSAPRFGAPGDANRDNQYDLIVQASDGSLSDRQTLSVQVRDVPDAPRITSFGGAAAASLSLDENQRAVLNFSATDEDAGSTLRWRLAGGADASLFSINASTGELSLRVAADHEAPADADGNNRYDLVVEVSDGLLTDTQSLTLSINDVAEAPRITSGGGAASLGLNLAENAAAGSAVLTLQAADPDASSTLRWRLAGGADASLFSINASTGQLSLRVSPDHEAPVDADGNNRYDVIVEVSDGELTDTQAIALSVTDVAEAPRITSGGGAASHSLILDENQRAVMNLTATDADAGSTLRWRLAGGADASLFSINASTGELSLRVAPDHEAPADADGNNRYDVIVEVSDGELTDTQTLALTVRNVNEAPVLLSHQLTVSEGGVARPVIQAGDGDTPPANLVYQVQQLSGGHFELSQRPGVAVLQFTQADLDAGRVSFHHDGGEAAPRYQLSLGDGEWTTEAVSAAVQFTPVNDLPVLPPVNLGSSPEDGRWLITTAQLLAGASDADGDVLQVRDVTLLQGQGTLVDLGQGRWAFTPDADWSGELRLGFVVDDGSVQLRQVASGQVLAVNDAPRFTSHEGAAEVELSRPENGQVVTTLSAGDVDTAGSGLRYSISGGADAALFTLDPATGELRFLRPPDHERPRDEGGDNRYQVVVSVSDGELSASQQLTVSVSNVDEAPQITRNVLVLSQGTVTLVLQSSDPDTPADQLRYQVDRVSGGHFELVDQAGVAIASFDQAQVNAGQVRFVLDGEGATPDYRLSLSDAVSTVWSDTPTLQLESVDNSVTPVVEPAPTPDSGEQTAGGESGRETPTSDPRPTPPVETGRITAPAPAAEAQAGAESATPGLEIRPGAAAVSLPPIATPRGSAAESEALALPELGLDTDSAAAGLNGLPDELATALRESRLNAALDLWRESADNDVMQQRDRIVSSVAVSSGLSVGYMLWLARGGVLMASVMSALPAWASLDPLPVLAQLKRQGSDPASGDAPDDDALEDLFDAPRPPVAAPPVAAPGDAARPTSFREPA